MAKRIIQAVIKARTRRLKIGDVRQLGVFGIVGGVATLVHYGTAIVAAEYSGISTANLIGFLVAFSVSYVGHSRMTFRLAPDERDHISRLPRFLVTAIAGFSASQAVLLVAKGGGFPSWISLAVATAAIPLFSFFVARFWVFRR